MASARRIGAPDAKNRGVLLDAAEQLMLDEGYAAVTSRRVAEKAGLKPQLVHYYFRTMDDLFLAVFRRRAEQGLVDQAQALKSPKPLWALWRFGTDPAASRLTMEIMGLANHRKARAEIAYYAERFRAEQTKAMTAALQRYGVDVSEVPPVVDGIRHQRFFGDGDGAGAGHVGGSCGDAGILRRVAPSAGGGAAAGADHRVWVSSSPVAY
jgi:AcrR family transcriptional regulator